MLQLKALDAVKSKQLAIKAVDDQINDDSEGETLINNYLPNKKIEERILTGINFLATDSQVSLVNISIQDRAEDSVNSAAETTAVAGLAVAGLAPNSEITDKKVGMQATEATISIVGEYDKINLFLDQIQRISIFNSIKSLNIAPQANEEKEKTVSEDGTVIEAVDDANKLNLTADLVVDFGWMDTVSIDNRKIEKFQSGLDVSTIAVVKQFISQKAPAVDKSGDAEGKTNPFLP